MLFQRIVREVFKDTYQVTSDADFAFYNSAEPESIKIFNHDGSGGPDKVYPWIDMVGGINSPWNSKVVALLVAKSMDRKESKKLKLPDNVWEKAVIRKLYIIRGIWKNAQPQHDPKTGAAE